MANTILTADVILKEAKRVFKNSCPFITSMERSYDDTYEAMGAGAGDSIRIRRPMKYTMRTGKTMDTQNTTEDYVTLPRTNWNGIDMKFSQKDLTLDITRFSELYIKPAISILASGVERAAMNTVYKQVYNAITLPVTNLDRDDVLEAQRMLTEFSAPEDGRYAVVSPKGQADLISQNASIFNPSKEVARQYKTGSMGTMYGFDFGATANVVSHTTGADATGAVDGASQTGATLTVDGYSAAPAEGDVVTLAGVYALNPVTQQSTGQLQRFVIGSGATTTSLPITPSIVITGNQKTVSGSPANDAVISTVGSASTAYPQNLFYQKQAFAFGSVDMALPKGLDFAARNSEDNLSMSIMSDFDIIGADMLTRLDILWGIITVTPEFATRVYGV